MKGLFTLLLWLLCLSAFAQKQKSTIEQIWFGYSNQTRFSDKWGIIADLNFRTRENYTQGLSQGLVQVGLTRYLDKIATRVTAAFTYVENFPGDNHPGISQPELRPWQQIAWTKKRKPLRMSQSVRLEERFRRKLKNGNELAHGYTFNYRLRYNVYFYEPLSKKAFAPHTFAAVWGDEVYLNFGKQIVYNTFDQNRIFLGFVYYPNRQDNLQFGYTYIFQQLSRPKQYRITHAPRITYIHSLDFRKTDKPRQKVSPLQNQ
ncbi:MAG: DUF2490 domain-containing protein [Bacteroidota bacterium]|nr:DUF2490 domain-containing protein [Flavisolibacter sp.]MBD0299790.1 DUF2490 domain-containing protein [Nitrososphaera sp.]MDQ3846663.1 DUF2490 domain-containing protein [Bacteroidota bacterium]MBD0284302.1 DUF2490 domain-containing protein [Flavisolibacter sp.]MBD0296288.1 DUF2490 domain-containing protein [Flavisolibacter sp.]